MTDAIARPMPGTVPRNDLPGFKPYVYRGLGYDTLTPRMTRRQLATAQQAAGRQVPGFKPYVYGATLGTPSRGRPDRVLAAVEAGVTEADRRPRPQAQVAATAPGPVEPGRCDACGYLLTSPGHRLECGTE